MLVQSWEFQLLALVATKQSPLFEVTVGRYEAEVKSNDEKSPQRYEPSTCWSDNPIQASLFNKQTKYL
jgi:hypothetical protein